MDRLTPNEVEAVWKFAGCAGRCWKAKLRDCRARARYDGLVPDFMEEALHGAATKLMAPGALDGITKTALDLTRPGTFSRRETY